MQAAAREQGRKIDPSPLSLYSFFVERVKRNLHIFLVMSPIGEAFRVRLRMFPSLINCCTIDWYMKLPTQQMLILFVHSIIYLSLVFIKFIRKSYIMMRHI
jgi:dynein heavy chain